MHFSHTAPRRNMGGFAGYSGSREYRRDPEYFRKS